MRPRRCLLPVFLLTAFLSAGMASGQTPGPSSAGQAEVSPLASRAWEAPPSPTAVIEVPPALLSLLEEKVIKRSGSHQERLDALVAMLFDADGLALQYQGDTGTIAEAYTKARANCVTFSLLFVALARRAGIDAHVQETDHVLAWQGTDALYGNGHVNVAVKIGRSRSTVDIDRSVIAVRGVPRTIDDDRALSHFYNNRSAELMREGHLREARAHLLQAIALTPGFVPAWNNLGVLDAREGALDGALAAYAKALELDPRHAPTLSNLVNYYRRVGNHKLQAEFERRLFREQRRDPFHQVILALGYEKRGDSAQAASHYRRALRLGARQHFVYFGLARASARLGDMRRAMDALSHARDAEDADRSVYQAKLDRLKRMHDR